jgi:hypothetical protein
MRYALLFLIMVFPASSLAQDSTHAEATPDRDTLLKTAVNRDALLKAAVSRDRGRVTAMEAFGAPGNGVAVGYSSGAVLNCRGENQCVEYSGTPSAPVEHLAVSGQEGSEVIWVAYGQGSLYRCVGRICSRFVWDSASTP